MKTRGKNKNYFLNVIQNNYNESSNKERLKMEEIIKTMLRGFEAAYKNYESNKFENKSFKIMNSDEEKDNQTLQENCLKIVRLLDLLCEFKKPAPCKKIIITVEKDIELGFGDKGKLLWARYDDQGFEFENKKIIQNDLIDKKKYLNDSQIIIMQVVFNSMDDDLNLDENSDFFYNPPRIHKFIEKNEKILTQFMSVVDLMKEVSDKLKVDLDAVRKIRSSSHTTH